MDHKRQSYKERNYHKMKEREYSKSYLKEKEQREYTPNTYPFARMVMLKDVLSSWDLYKAIIYFLATQVVLIIIAAANFNPEIAGALNLLAIVIGLVLVFTAIRSLRYKQALDASRRKVKLSTIIMTLVGMYIAMIFINWGLAEIGIETQAQPNQSSLEELSSLFPIAMIFTIIIVSPVVEEYVFRELLPYSIGPSYISFFISSFIFVALHAPFGIIGWTSYLVLAGGFLFARLKDNNIFTAIIVHIIWNAVSVLL